MSTLIYLLAFTFIGASNPTPTQNEPDSAADQLKVEQAVIQWADAVFKKHENYKFEQFKPFYTDDYFIQTMRIELYAEKIAALEKKKTDGDYTGTEEAFQSDIKKLSGAIEKAKLALDKIDRVDYFQIHFWTNILTKDGITVYYELILKLDGNYAVTQATENSSIGKKGADSKIAYAKDAAGTRVIEKP